MKKDKNRNKGKFQIYLFYIWKKIRDAKIRTKLIVYLALVAVICSLTIGGVAYMTMRVSLVDHAQDSAVSLLKHIGTRMDERIREYQDASYSFSKREDILSILDEEDVSETQLDYVVNQEILNRNLLLFSSLHKYSDGVVMESLSGEIYLYNQQGRTEKISTAEAEELLERYRDEVSETNPVKWVRDGEKVYFVRRLVERKFNQKVQGAGMMIFAVSESFFECGDDTSRYVSNDHLVIAGTEGWLYKNSEVAVSEQQVHQYTAYQDNKYYVYTTTQKVAGEDYLVVPLRTEKYQWNILCFIPYSVIMEKANLIIWQVIITMVLLLVIGLGIAISLYKVIQKNLNIIEDGMKEYEKGNYTLRLSPSSYDEIGLTILQFNHMGLKINELNELTRKEQEENQELEYMVMEAQINPHFLYNTLGSLKWLAYEKEEEEIARLADAIINLLRFTVKNANRFIPLREELDYIRHYIYIQKARYEDTFTEYIRITDEAEDFLVIGFILQPFIENSIIHGLDNSRTDGMIEIKGEVKERCLYLTVSDNGRGIPEEKLTELNQKVLENSREKHKGFNGIGIVNVLRRMRAVYGMGFQYEIRSEPGKGTTVVLIVPERGGENEETHISS